MGGGSGAGDADQKLRVLCLHGFTQNGETFRQRTGSIRKQLKKKIDFVFIDAPHDVACTLQRTDTRIHAPQLRKHFFVLV